MDSQTLFLVSIVGAIALAAYFVVALFTGDKGAKALRGRLTSSAKEDARKVQKASQASVPLLQRLGAAAAQPFMPKNREAQSGLRKTLANAGFYQPSMLRIMVGFKVIFMFVGLGLGYALGLMMNQMMLGLSVGGLVGYLTPAMWLRSRVKSNKKALQYGLPDALDLMVVCVEAGLTVDAAMQRVGQELHIAHPAISRELGICHMETQVGLSRSESLRNLGTRTGSEPLQSLAAMLIQADRFGTSIAQALRVHADTLRTARQHAAEELAAKASVKMSFPLVLFIFPSTFIVLAGPTVIGLMHSSILN
ncbi:MAG: type II secretion system F family protein [Phycisphaerae bacterium]|nr:type II secretion system F family protein [Phycisphaerae bacterium]